MNKEKHVSVRNLAHPECLDLYVNCVYSHAYRYTITTMRLGKSPVAPVQHTLLNDVHRNRVRHLILNAHHHVIHVHIFPLVASASPQHLGKDRKKEKKIKVRDL